MFHYFWIILLYASGSVVNHSAKWNWLQIAAQNLYGWNMNISHHYFFYDGLSNSYKLLKIWWQPLAEQLL